MYWPWSKPAQHNHNLDTRVVDISGKQTDTTDPTRGHSHKDKKEENSQSVEAKNRVDVSLKTSEKVLCVRDADEFAEVDFRPLTYAEVAAIKGASHNQIKIPATDDYEEDEEDELESHHDELGDSVTYEPEQDTLSSQVLRAATKVTKATKATKTTKAARAHRRQFMLTVGM